MLKILLEIIILNIKATKVFCVTEAEKTDAVYKITRELILEEIKKG